MNVEGLIYFMSVKATTFIYKSYKFEKEKKKIIFKYEIEFEDGRSMEFIDKVVLPKDEASAKGKLLHCYNNAEFDNLLHSLHIILGISYYKLFVPPKIKLTKPLSKNQAEFFNTVYKKGLGEFCYRNKIDPERIAKFPFASNIQSNFHLPAVEKSPLSPLWERGGRNRILLGIAGGKDSIVAGELLKQHGENITGFLVDTHDNMHIPEKIAEIMGVKMLKIRHELDEKILNLTSTLPQYTGQASSKERAIIKDAYKGHIPFSAVVGFLGTLIAYLYGYSYVAVGNEHSANFGNITYKGEEVNPAPFGQNNLAISWFSKSKENISRKDGFQIFRKDKLPERCGVNHQWSKTSEFEGMMQKYVHEYISPNITYFSAIRPFYEIRVVEIFSKYKKYFPYFASCNESFKKDSSLFQREDRRDFSMIIPRSINKTAFPSPTHRKIPLSPPLQKGETRLWCGECPKCAFVFTMLAAFLTKKELLAIFGKNLYEDKKLLPVFNDLLGLGKLKPFDCVGTFEEMRVAFSMAGKKYKDTPVMREFLEKVKSIVANIDTPLKGGEVFKTQPAPNLPDEVKFLGIKNVLILGYGKEGKAVHEYLKNKYPKIKIGIADQKQDKNYLARQEKFDLVIKSPGVPKNLVTRPYTTPTNIFFASLEGEVYKPRRLSGGICEVTYPCPITIGITGSKGKSTTSSLIYSIFKEAGKNVELIGNIGKPMLEALSKPIKKDTIFVIEMSSYQLDDIKFSPDVAVILNLFPDHMPYHNGIENYYNAKRNIVEFQNKESFFIYSSKYKLLREWAKEANGKAIKFNETHFERSGQATRPTHGGTGFLDPVMRNLKGEHNIENIKATITVAKLFDISDEIIEKAIRNFKPLPHRLEFVGEFCGIKFYNDSISTTPESAIAAIEALKDSPPCEGGVRGGNPISTILLGGEDRGYDFKNLEKIVKKYKIKNIVLFPDTGKRIFESKKDRNGLNILETSSMREAVNFAYKHGHQKSICLLSPASPSHNLWNNFEERGEEFRKWVRKIHLNYNSPNSPNKMANVKCQIL